MVQALNVIGCNMISMTAELIGVVTKLLLTFLRSDELSGNSSPFRKMGSNVTSISLVESFPRGLYLKEMTTNPEGNSMTPLMYEP